MTLCECRHAPSLLPFSCEADGELLVGGVGAHSTTRVGENGPIQGGWKRASTATQ
jgi:hypothetical protein